MNAEFGSSGVTVTIGNEECAVDSFSDTEIQCTVGRFPVGLNKIAVHATSKGI